MATRAHCTSVATAISLKRLVVTDPLRFFLNSLRLVEMTGRSCTAFPQWAKLENMHSRRSALSKIRFEGVVYPDETFMRKEGPKLVFCKLYVTAIRLSYSCGFSNQGESMRQRYPCICWCNTGGRFGESEAMILIHDNVMRQSPNTKIPYQ